MKSALLIFSILFIALIGNAQEADTIKRQLNDVVITGYLSRQPIIQVPASVAVLDSLSLSKGYQQSLIPVMNTIPGIRMEERSPGSYRLSIRGSLLRSPFGIRNVKVYFNDLPLTDASGNAYLNLVDPAMLQRVEILKGPDGSLFGANSGGVVLLESHQRDSSGVTGSLSGGSYGMFRGHLGISHISKRFEWNFTEAFQRSDGYREQSAMKRLSLLNSMRLRYGLAHSIKFTMLFSDLHYKTPGGLTKAQFEEKPEQARPRINLVPGAVEQHTGIYNTTFFSGLTNELNFSSGIRWVISGFGTVTDYRNPFINNYEIRNEKNAGLRTFIEYTVTSDQLILKFYGGAEGQFGLQTISNYQNNGGVRGALQSEDEVEIAQPFYFTKVTLDLADRLTAEAAISLNKYSYKFKGNDIRNLSNEWMPRLAVSYRIMPEFAVRASVSRGYSPPTIAEIRPSGAIINESLNAESGWNKELGARLSMLNGRLQADASVFRYDLTNAIVRRTEDDVELFVNSGGTKQTGIELLLNTTLISARDAGFVQNMSANLSYTFSRFLFDSYAIDEEDYSGNRVTGVPRTTWVAGLSLVLAKRVNVFVQSLFVSRLPLNDGNDDYAEAYELLQGRVGWKAFQKNKFSFEFFAGGDNLLSQTYSLGNDLNAFGGRYYNAAPLRNFYTGINVTLP